MRHMLFVYGTLKKGFGNHGLLANAEFKGNAITQEKYALYVAGIPFVIKDESISHIHGELYVVNQATLAKLDRLEGHPDCYKRETIKVSLEEREAAEAIAAWIYFYPEKRGLLIQSGIYEIR
ncbi:gamma-glutamylcyclotransferase family protein [Desulforegula conservatrix]|uniref:gamma-glutamylcyclotransferase family protein n=1 Tax=Desulforegula conservatrix TaxID=153026 RepID=UPI0004095925|nr:gamma-glutamylcyclotransferase family protein [Desulforegula conservatrix]